MRVWQGARSRLCFALLSTLALVASDVLASETPGPTDPAELEAFLDGLLPALMETHHVPGAVFVMVKDGGVFFKKGYGFADVESRRPVDPDSTIFRLASVSKLFTATAAMQLVEQGKLDLATDVNQVLKEGAFQIEETYEAPITLAHLLTHTAGFDDRFLRSSRSLGAAFPSLGRYLAARMPPRVMPPGEVISYSNHGFTLVGYLVELASGLPFEEYIQRHIFDPLGMTRSRFGLSVPVQPELAVPFAWKDGKHESMGFDHTLLGPAAELNSTGTDMARFMIAHLQQGRFGDTRILREETAREMHAQQFSHHPELSGWCYGFVEDRVNGLRSIGHDGDWRGFRTNLVLLPETKIGFFVSLNGAFEGPFWRDFGRVFADHYFPAPNPPPSAPPEDFAERAARYTGTYVPNRRFRSSLLKLGQFRTAVQVSANDDGTLRVGLAGVDPIRLTEIGPDLFRLVDDEHKAAFLADDHDRVVRLVFNSFALDRLPWFRTPWLHALAGGVAILFFVATLAGWLLGTLARRLAGAPESPVSGTARIVASVVCILDATSVVGIAVILTTTDIFELFEAVPVTLQVLLVLPIVSVPFTLALPWVALREFRGASTLAPAPLARLHYWTLTALALLLGVIAFHWNLLGFHY